MRQRNGSAIRGRLQAVVDVVHALERHRLPRVHLDDDFVSLLNPRLVVADRRTRNHPSVLEDGGDFDEGNVELAKESVLHELSHVAQVDVHVLHFAGVDALAGFGIGLIGQAQVNAAGHGESAVQLRACGGAGEDADLKLLAAQVGVGNATGKRHGHSLRITGAGEAAHADLVAVLDQGGGFFGAHDARFRLAFKTREVVATADEDMRYLSHGEDSAALTLDDRDWGGRPSVRRVTKE